MRCVIFDLDGTLADTSADLIAAANAALAQEEPEAHLDPRQDAATAFRGAKAMLRLGLSRTGDVSEARVDALYPVLLDRYGEHIDVHTTLYPGAMDAVETLKSAGFAVGICTNKPEGLAETLLARLGIRDAFSSMIGAETVGVRKPHPKPLFEAARRAKGDPRRTILIGDTVTDREAARAAGMPSVLVTFGPTGRAVAELEPEALLDHYDALPALAEHLLPTR